LTFFSFPIEFLSIGFAGLFETPRLSLFFFPPLLALVAAHSNSSSGDFLASFETRVLFSFPFSFFLLLHPILPLFVCWGPHASAAELSFYFPFIVH